LAFMPSAQAMFKGSFSERAPGPPGVHDELIAAIRRKAKAAIGLCKRIIGILQIEHRNSGGKPVAQKRSRDSP
jgi:hypothetical protein